MEKFLPLISRVSGLTEAPPVLPKDVNARFHLWLNRGTVPWENDGYPFWSVFYHLQSFWRFRQLPNIHFIHYADLKRDLEGEMRRIAADRKYNHPFWRGRPLLLSNSNQVSRNDRSGLPPFTPTFYSATANTLR